MKVAIYVRVSTLEQAEDGYSIREQPDVEDGEIAAALVDGDTEATLKRIKRQGDLVMLMPDNKNYDPIILDKRNPGRIIGKAVHVSWNIE